MTKYGDFGFNQIHFIFSKKISLFSLQIYIKTMESFPTRLFNNQLGGTRDNQEIQVT